MRKKLRLAEGETAADPQLELPLRSFPDYIWRHVLHSLPLPSRRSPGFIGHLICFVSALFSTTRDRHYRSLPQHFASGSELCTRTLPQQFCGNCCHLLIAHRSDVYCPIFPLTHHRSFSALSSPISPATSRFVASWLKFSVTSALISLAFARANTLNFSMSTGSTATPPSFTI